MNVFVWEALSAGIGPVGRPTDSLRVEGAAMLAVVVADLLCVDGVRVSTLLSRPFPAGLPPRVRVESAGNADGELASFRRLAAQSDTCWIIAPETGGLLAERIRIAEEAGAACCNCSHDATELCGDKLRLFEFLRDHDIPTIDTQPDTRCFENTRCLPAGIVFPYVVKPRHGAGSDGCRLVESPAEWEGQAPAVPRAGRVVQPFVPGTPVSTAVIARGKRRSVFPIGLQSVDRDDHLHYAGGVIPAGLAQTESDAVVKVVQRCLRAIDGLRGYVGFDLILPETNPSTPVLVEINPRLTTAYVGYRELTADNLAERVVFPERSRPQIEWTDGVVRFAADGDCVCNAVGL